VAHSKSAKKRIGQNEQRRARNRRRKSQVKETVRQYERALASGQADQAADQLRNVYRSLDRVAAKGTIHKKTASRRKSRLAKRLTAKAG